MAKLTGGEAIVKSLLANGVDTLFGLPGVQNDFLYNALYDHGSDIRVIHTRHEQATAYMALGYALSTGKVGVYSVVPGPGFLNTTAALATAYGANARVLCLAGQIASDDIGKGIGMLHEIPDQLGILRSLTKWAERIDAPGKAPGLVAEAFRQMHTGRPRPVGLEIPQDVLSASEEVTLMPGRLPVQNPPVDGDAVARAARLLGKSKNPLIFVGGGAMDATAEVQELAELLQAPVVAYTMGRGVLSSRHYLSHFLPAGYTLWPTADMILAIGTRLVPPLRRWGMDAAGKLIKIDIDPEEHGRSAQPVVSLVADARDALQALVPEVEKHNRIRASRESEMLALKAATAKKSAYLEPQLSYIKVIREEMPDDAIFVEEVTQIGFVSKVAMPVYRPRSYIAPGYQGTLGWGVATALGVKVANPDKPVVAVTGDGGFMFNVQELATAVQQQIGVVFLLFNDGAYGNVRRMQKELYGGRLIASDLHNPDFVKLAEAFGAQGLRAGSLEELRLALRQGMATSGPTLVEIPVGEMPSPWPLIFWPGSLQERE
jgi:acetolactate synthase-1/2/3 large subunit